MTFSNIELYWIAYCVNDTHERNSSVVGFEHLLERIHEERTRQQAMRTPRTISETKGYKAAYYAKNANKIRPNARKRYWINKEKKKQAGAKK